MAYCRICGDERETRYYISKRQTLCRACAADTPAKIGRRAFDARYWPGATEPVPDAVKRDFYEDYLRSTHSFADYIAATREG